MFRPSKLKRYCCPPALPVTLLANPCQVDKVGVGSFGARNQLANCGQGSAEKAVSEGAARAPVMIVVDCTELSSDEKLALADAISTGLEGLAFALPKGDSIVLDQLTEEKVDQDRVMPIIKDFFARRKASSDYSAEIKGETIVVHSSDPIAAMQKKRGSQLPPNLYQCPFCPYVTQYEEQSILHSRLHFL